MSTADVDKLPAKNNWMPEVKQSFSSILFSANNPPVHLTHFAIEVVFHMKPYGHYGQSTKHLDTASAIINYALSVNRFLVPHHKLGGQHLHQLTHDMLQNWVEALCDNYAGHKTKQYFQGDGAAPSDIADVLVDSGIPAHALTNGNN